MITLNTSMLAIARLAAGAAGFPDVDVEPMEPGKVTVTATGPGRKITVKGSSVDNACENLIRAMWPEV